MKKLRVFDLDHTLLNCNISFEFGRHLYKKGWFSFFKMISLCSLYARHKFLNLSIDELHHSIFDRLFKGRPFHKVKNEVDEFLKSLPTRLYFPAARLIESNSIVLSSSPDFLVGPVCEYLGIKQWKATSYIVDKEGMLCHISKLVDGKNKACVLEEIAKEQHLKQADLVFFTDSILDLPVLEVAGSLIAVQPDRKLKKLALARGWEIIDEPSVYRSN